MKLHRFNPTEFLAVILITVSVCLVANDVIYRQIKNPKQAERPMNDVDLERRLAAMHPPDVPPCEACDNLEHNLAARKPIEAKPPAMTVLPDGRVVSQNDFLDALADVRAGKTDHIFGIKVGEKLTRPIIVLNWTGTYLGPVKGSK